MGAPNSLDIVSKPGKEAQLQRVLVPPPLAFNILQDHPKSPLPPPPPPSLNIPQDHRKRERERERERVVELLATGLFPYRNALTDKQTDRRAEGNTRSRCGTNNGIHVAASVLEK